MFNIFPFRRTQTKKHTITLFYIIHQFITPHANIIVYLLVHLLNANICECISSFVTILLLHYFTKNIFVSIIIHTFFTFIYWFFLWKYLKVIIKWTLHALPQYFSKWIKYRIHYCFEHVLWGKRCNLRGIQRARTSWEKLKTDIFSSEYVTANVWQTEPEKLNRHLYARLWSKD